MQSAERSSRKAVTCSRGCTCHRIDLDPRASTTTSRGSQAMRPDTFRSRPPQSARGAHCSRSNELQCCTWLQSQSIVVVGCAPSPRARMTPCPPCYNRWRYSPLALQCCPCAVTILVVVGCTPSTYARSTPCPPCCNRWRYSPLALQCCPCAVTIYPRRRLCSVDVCSLDALSAML